MVPTISGYNELNMYEDETAMLAGHVSINMTAAAVAMVDRRDRRSGHRCGDRGFKRGL